MDNNQLLKFLQLGMGYQLPKLKHETSVQEEIPEQPFFMEVCERDEETGETKIVEQYDSLSDFSKRVTHGEKKLTNNII